jgi:hypothetical protein
MIDSESTSHIKANTINIHPMNADIKTLVSLQGQRIKVETSLSKGQLFHGDHDVKRPIKNVPHRGSVKHYLEMHDSLEQKLQHHVDQTIRIRRSNCRCHFPMLLSGMITPFVTATAPKIFLSDDLFFMWLTRFWRHSIWRFRCTLFRIDATTPTSLTSATATSTATIST